MMDQEKLIQLVQQVWGAEDGAVHIGSSPNQLSQFATLIEQHIIESGWRQCAVGQRTTQFCAMTDRELLELAAKAAGIEGQFTFGSGNALELAKPRGFQVYWNPLNNDGDALRLAVKLNLAISIPVHKTIRADVIWFLDSSVNIREEEGDVYAATRRAIVRAAAEIGKQMGGSDE